MSQKAQPKKPIRKVKKFRFQLLHEWIVSHVQTEKIHKIEAPKDIKNDAHIAHTCRIADIGGGKGLLSLLLNNDSSCAFECTVIDPFDQALPTKYKSLEGERHKISAEKSVSRINKHFEIEMAADFDILIGMHAHGSNMKTIEAAARYKKDFILLPCCVIDEPVVPQANIDWFESLEAYAHSLGIKTERFELNFRGQNRGFYSTNSGIIS